MRQVAITGFGVVSPIGSGRESFWSALSEGKSGIDEIRGFDAATFEVRLAGEIESDLPLDEKVTCAAHGDRNIGFAFSAFHEAMGQAGIGRLDERCLLHIGTSLEFLDLRKLIRKGKADYKQVAADSLNTGGPPLQVPLDIAANTIMEHFGSAGSALTNCSACAASAQAIGHGFQAVRSGRFETAVCGGFDSMINPLGMGGFQMLRALTTSNERGSSACRPFDATRNGAVLGEGAAMVVLEPLEKAKAEGKAILAEVRGYGSTLDAYNLSAPDPQGDGALRSMSAALEDAGIGPERIDHINAHGTGTELNDPMEAGAIREVFADSWENIPVSATKSMTGHLIGAAGALEVGACLLALVRGVLPPNISLKSVGRGCELDHVRQPRPFEGEAVLSNSFGFGGQNATLILRKCNG